MKPLLISIFSFFFFSSYGQEPTEWRTPLKVETPLVFEVLNINAESLSLCYTDQNGGYVTIQRMNAKGEILNRATFTHFREYRHYLGYIENDQVIHCFFAHPKKNKRYFVFTLDKQTNQIKRSRLSPDLHNKWDLFGQANISDQFFQVYSNDGHRNFELVFIDDALNIRYQSVDFTDLFKQAGVDAKRLKRTFLDRSGLDKPVDMNRFDWFHPLSSKNRIKFTTLNNSLCLIFDHVVFVEKKSKVKRIGSIYMTYNMDHQRFDVFPLMNNFNHAMESTQTFAYNENLYQLRLSIGPSASETEFMYQLSKVDPIQKRVDSLVRFKAEDISSLFEDEIHTRFNPYFTRENTHPRIWNIRNITRRGVTEMTNVNRRPYANIYENRKLFSFIKTSTGYNLLLGVTNKGRVLDNHAPLDDAAYLRQFGIGATPYTSRYFYLVSTLNKDFEFDSSSTNFYSEMMDRYASMDLKNISNLDYVMINDQLHFSYIDRLTKEFVITSINY